MPSIADLILEVGRAKAAGVLGAGQAWGNAISSIGQQVGGTLQQYAQQANDPRRQLELQQVEANQRGQQFQGAVNGILSQLTKQNPDGSRTLDRGQLQQAFASQNIPLPMQEQVFKSLDDVDASLQKFQSVKNDHLADIAHGVLQTGATPENLAFGVALAKANGLVTDADLAPLTQAVAQGADIKSVLTQVRGLSEKYKDASKPVILPRPGAQLVSPTGDTLATAPVEPPKPVSVAPGASLVNPTTGTALYTAPAKPDSGTQDDQRYERVIAAQQLKQPVTPEDLAFATAYEKRKTLGPEASAAAAADRQLATIAQQNDIQRKGQAFTQAQAGRAELTQKIEQPYLDAREKADTLKGVIEAAKNGNMEAAAVQPLLGVLGLVTMEGVKRINTTELDQVAGAGSLLERIKGQASKLTSGQPMTPKLQSDLTDLANMLEQSARKKYEQGFISTTKRYRLTDEQMLPTSAALQKPIPGIPGGQSAGPKVGDVVSVGGKTVKITAIHPDGSFDGDPVKK